MSAALARRAPVGVLLLNVGTPESPETGPVRAYLREFLGDPRVIDIPALPRWLLLNLVILPTRPRQSAEAYRKVWMEEGSPLLVHTIRLAKKLAARLGDGWAVEPAMRYGRPSIAEGLERLRARGVERIVVAPLFPQYASSSTGTAVEEVFRQLGRQWNVPAVSVLEPFYGDDGFIEAFAARARESLADARAEHVLFSFHGLPERQVHKGDPSGSHCLRSEGCCAVETPANRFCYRAQCYRTAALIAGKLGLEEGAWSVSFQSRLGRTPWIQPYTDAVLPALLEKGVRRVAVICPAFVSDCLETLEEIGMRAKEDFLAAGGESLELVPSLNDSPAWVEALAALVERACGRPSGAALPVLPRQVAAAGG